MWFPLAFLWPITMKCSVNHGVFVCAVCVNVCVVYNKIIVFYHLGEVKHLYQNISQSCIFVCLCTDCTYLCEAVRVITSYGGVWKPLI